jgi:hypothetical protein
VESCTALVEDFAGAISIVEWKDDPSASVAFAEAVEQVA